MSEIEEEYEKYGLICPYETFACDCCTNYGCISNKNPDKEREKYI